MDILFMSPYKDERSSAFEQCFLATGDNFERTEDRIDVEFLRKFDLGVSYGYRHILPQEALDICPIINCHISYRPWNRGADPNVWSWIEGTPKGVSIHYMDRGIDTGPIICQKLTDMDDSETLSSSYKKLSRDMVALFVERWPEMRSNQLIPVPQNSKGTFHLIKHREKISHILEKGNDVPIKSIIRRVHSG